MRKLFTVALVAASLLTFSCNSKDDKGKDTKEITKDEDDNNGKDETDNKGSDIKKAAAAYCDCFNDGMGEMDPKLKKIIIKAAKSDDPQTALQQAVMDIDDKEEQMRLAEEMQKFGNMEGMDNCTKKVAKKYDLNENDKKVQKQILQELEENDDCELVAALMRIGLKQGNTERGTTDEE